MLKQHTQSNCWKEWNDQGLIPGPDESEDAFIERVAFCQHLEKHLTEKVGINLPFEVNDQISQHLLKDVLPITQDLYGISPYWVPIFCSNYQLAPWHGGCAWIFQLDEQTPTTAFLQLRAHFKNSPYYLGLYHRRELIAHELAHVGRMLYQEPQFEEILAYQSSSSSWRRWLGPIIQSSKESLFFIITLGISVLTEIALMSVNLKANVLILWGLQFLPLLLIIFALGRLIYRQQILKRCQRHLKTLYSRPQIAQHLLYRLTDSEIRKFAFLTPSAIQKFMETAQQNSFRWRFLMALYHPNY